MFFNLPAVFVAGEVKIDVATVVEGTEKIINKQKVITNRSL